MSESVKNQSMQSTEESASIEFKEEIENQKLDILIDYFKYLHEGEKSRLQSIKSIRNSYLLFVTTTFTVLLGIVKLFEPYAVIALSVDDANIISVIKAIVIAIAVVFLILSFLFLVNSAKVGHYERLCDPRSAVLYFDIVGSLQVKREIVANYVAAAAQNFELNESKAIWLQRALLCYFIAVAFLFLSGIAIALENSEGI